jgi:NAD(P)H-nitrite reductase large subunit
MSYTYEDLQLVAKHVSQAEKNVQQQRTIVAELKANGYPIGEALDTLATLDAALAALRQRHARIHAEVEAAELPESVD